MAFAGRLSTGELTQLEWLDMCARRLEVDGVVCDVRHFPRRDSDYLAQIKKMATDLGLTISALWSGDFFTNGEDGMRGDLELALEIGAPIVSASLSTQTQRSWSDELACLDFATALAKNRNVTLAVRNAPGGYAATSHDLKRLTKEADSAWLRYALEIEALDAASVPESLMSKTVLLWHVHDSAEVHSDEDDRIERFLELTKDYRGHLALDFAEGAADEKSMHAAVRSWRTILATATLGDSIGA